MSKAVACAPACETLDVTQLFFVNLSLLGFDASAMERKHRIPFNKEMFNLPNKKGFETVVYFLFNRLDTARCKEQFRDCWPISDKKEEQLFRKICTNWLEQIVKDDLNAGLPRIGAALFMSPGGEKFQQFLFCFSRYVLTRVMICEHGARSPSEFPLRPLLTPNNSNFAVILANSVAASATVLQQRFIKLSEQINTIQNEWASYADELTKEYRNTVRSIRDLERDLKAEMHRVSESKVARTVRNGSTADYDDDIKAVQRAQAVQQVRGMWKAVDDFCSSLTSDQEVVDSILHRTVEKYRIDVTELSIKLPDLLLRECEQEIQRRNVDNIYKEGKVNLLSLIHLWNLSLHLYIEKMHEVGMPDLDIFSSELQTMLQNHRSHLASAETYKKSLEHELVPDLHHSVDLLKKCRETGITLANEVSPSTARLTSLGLSLMPPTPPVSFDPQDVSQSSGRRSDQHLRLQSIPTPDGASQLLADVDSRIRVKRHDSSLLQGQPLYGPRSHSRGTGNSPYVHQLAAEDYALKEKPLVKQAAESKTRPPATVVTKQVNVPAHVQSRLPARDRKAHVKVQSTGSGTGNAHKQDTDGKAGGTSQHRFGKSDGQKLKIAVQRHQDATVSKTVPGAVPHIDLLVDTIVTRMMTASPDTENNDDECDPSMEMGAEVFQHRDRLARSPPTAGVDKQKCDVTTAEGGAGLLSSTHIDSDNDDSSQVPAAFIDPVAIRLFDPPIQSPRQQSNGVAVDERQLPHSAAHSSAPSSIHSVSTHEDSSCSVSDESLSVLESISGRTRDRLLATRTDRIQQPLSLELNDNVSSNNNRNIFADMGLVNCDETLRSLLDTKTPRLPLRFHSKAVGLSEAVVCEHAELDCSLCSLSENDVTPMFLHRSKAYGTSASQNAVTVHGPDASDLTRHLNNGKSRSNEVGAVSYGSGSSSNNNNNSADDEKRTVGSEINSAAGPRRLETTAELDSLIARYQNVRTSSSTLTEANKSASLQSNLKPSSVVCVSSPVTLNLSPITSTSGGLAVNSVGTDSLRSVPVPGTSVSDLASSSKREVDDGIQIEDVLHDLSLSDLSLADDVLPSFTPQSDHKGTPDSIGMKRFHAVSLSPMTEAVHRTSHVYSAIDPTRFELTSRISDILESDILREDGSLLVPMSPADDALSPPRKVVQTANLIDLS